jgi:hypothetical protein
VVTGCEGSGVSLENKVCTSENAPKCSEKNTEGLLYIRKPVNIFLVLVQVCASVYKWKTLKKWQARKPGPIFKKDTSFGGKKKSKKCNMYKTVLKLPK